MYSYCQKPFKNDTIFFNEDKYVFDIQVSFPQSLKKKNQVYFHAYFIKSFEFNRKWLKQSTKMFS